MKNYHDRSPLSLQGLEWDTILVALARLYRARMAAARRASTDRAARAMELADIAEIGKKILREFEPGVMNETVRHYYQRVFKLTDAEVTPVLAPTAERKPDPLPTPTVASGEGPGPVHFPNGHLSTVCGVAFKNAKGPILLANVATQNISAVTCPDCLTYLAAVGH